MSRHSLGILVLLTIIFFFFSFYETSKIPNEKFVWIAEFVIGYSLYVWYRKDSRGTNRDTFKGIPDLGWFIFQVGFLIIPYHLIKTRKRRGWISIFVTLIIVIFAFIAGAFIGKTLD